MGSAPGPRWGLCTRPRYRFALCAFPMCSPIFFLEYPRPWPHPTHASLCSHEWAPRRHLDRFNRHTQSWLRCTVARTLVFDRRTFPVPCSTCSWRVTTYVGKTSAIGQPTRPIQPFVLPRSINWLVSYIGCVPLRSGGAIW